MVEPDLFLPSSRPGRCDVDVASIALPSPDDGEVIPLHIDSIRFARVKEPGEDRSVIHFEEEAVDYDK